MTVNHDTNGDELVSGDLLHDLVVGGLVEDDSVVRLILGLSLGPFLLLGLASRGRGRLSSLFSSLPEKQMMVSMFVNEMPNLNEEKRMD
jgi:hypothetical protein